MRRMENCLKISKLMAGMILTAAFIVWVHVLPVQAAENMAESVAETLETKEADSFKVDKDGVLTEYTGAEEKVTIPTNVKIIGENAFCDNKKIKNVIIPGNVKEIGDRAFDGCKNLESITLQDGLEKIGEHAFSYTNLKSIVIPKTVKTMGRLIFLKSHIESIDFTEGTYDINGDIIGIEDQLTSIKISKNNERYQVVDNVLYEKGKNTLCYCPAGRNKDLVVPDGIEQIGFSAFWNCGNIKITFPNSVKTIGDRAFLESKFESIILPENLEEIGSEAFCYSSGLKQITIPAKTKEIGTSAFGSCTALETINVASGNPVFQAKDGVLYGKEYGATVLINCPAGKKGEVTILDGTIAIRPRAFYECENITSINMPDSVRDIENEAFRFCYSLMRIRFSNRLESIYPEAFSNCAALRQVVLPDSVNYIGSGSFRYCYDLADVVISEQVSEIPENAFGTCSKLSSVTIPNGVSKIADNAFAGCKKLTIYCNAGSAAEKYAKDKNINSKVTDERKEQNILADNIEKTVGDSVFQIEAKTTGDGVLSYVSEDTDIINVSETGQATITGAGTTNVVIMASATENYKAAERVISVTVKKGENGQKRTQKITYSYQEEEDIFYLNAKTDGDGQLSYQSEDERIVKIDSNGKGYIISSGTVKIIITASETDTCQGAQEVISLSVEKIPDQTENPGQNGNTNQPGDTDQPGNTDQPGDTDQSGNGDANPSGSQNDAGVQQNTSQLIKAKDITKIYTKKTFSIGAKSVCGAKLSYKAADKKVATISKAGKIKLKSYGQTQITIRADAKGTYPAASKTITLTVKPVKNRITSLKSTKAKTLVVKWKKDKKASGYIIEYSTDKKFKKNVKRNVISKNKTVSKKITKLKPGKKYYVRVCTYKNSHGKKVQGDYSKVRTVKIRK